MIPNLKLVLHRESKAEAIYKAHTVVKAEEKKEKVDKDKDIILYLNKTHGHKHNFCMKCSNDIQTIMSKEITIN